MPAPPPRPDKPREKPNRFTTAIDDRLVVKKPQFDNVGGYVYMGSAWNPTNSQAYEKAMANKFLPFIVETSTPLHIFKTLLSRSKGMSNTLIASTFLLILKSNLPDLRDIVKDMPDMGLEEIYEELLIKFPLCRIPDERVKLFLRITTWFPDEGDFWIDDLKKFITKDIMLFFLAMSEAEQDLVPYTNIPFYTLIDSDRKDQVLSAIGDYVFFEDDGDKVYFDDEDDLSNFILYRALLMETMDPDAPKEPSCSICACFKKFPSDGSEL